MQSEIGKGPMKSSIGTIDIRITSSVYLADFEAAILKGKTISQFFEKDAIEKEVTTYEVDFDTHAHTHTHFIIFLQCVFVILYIYIDH